VKFNKLKLSWFITGYKNYSHILKAHLITMFNLLVSLAFALLPLIIVAATTASKKHSSIYEELKILFFDDAMFLYCSSFIAPLIILSFVIAFTKKRQNYKFYPFALLGSLYVLVFGALMYSGVFARNLYSLDQLPIVFPTNADISILITTLIVWYYSVFIDKYTPQAPVKNYTNKQDEAFNKFDKATK